MAHESPPLGRRPGIKESTAEWQILADGVQVQFQPMADDTGNRYRSGDYWLIPVRTATGNVDWPENTALPPQGIIHYYAPLAVVDISADLKSVLTHKLRKKV